MRMIRSAATVALAGMIAAPAYAQIVVNTDPRARIPRTVEGRSATAAKVPRGHLPPRGMCRVWIDGVPPGQQPPVTDCASAQLDRRANSTVIHGDQSSFPGRGHGKFKNAADRSDRSDAIRGCSIRDAVVVNGRVVDVCRDDEASRRGRRDRDRSVENFDDDRLERSQRVSKAERKARKHSRGRGRH